MNFPQYLWRINCKKGSLMIRRGNTSDEAIEKCLRKDNISAYYIIGIADYCDIADAKRYSKEHNWNWMES